MTRVEHGINTAKSVLRWLRARKFPVVALLALTLLAFPQTSRAQLPSPCCAILSAGLSSISSAISNVSGSGLNAISSTMNSIETFQKSVIWPTNLIDQARRVVGNLDALFGQIRSIGQLPVASATLPTPRKLEQTLLSSDPAQVPQVSNNYAAVYSSVPGPTDASPQVRNLIDLTDAISQGAMKRAIEIDAIADIELEAADEFLEEVQVAAPGSAPILEAGAEAWLVRANAYTQAALTELMRLRAIDLANAGAEMKIEAQQGVALRGNLNDALKRR